MKNSQDTPYNTARHLAACQRFEDETILPHRYVFVLTNKCNLDCKFCFQDRKTLPGAMSIEDWLTVIENLPLNSWVTLTGGEPLAFRDFERVLTALKHRNISFNVISNGVLLNESIIQQLQENRSFKGISISIDDIGNKNRDFRKGQWENLLGQLIYFKIFREKSHSDSYLDIKTVVLDSNADSLFEIYQFFSKEVRTDTHSFQFLKGSPVQHSDKMYDYLTGITTINGIPYDRWETITESLVRIGEHLDMSDPNRGVYLHPKFSSLRDPDLRSKLKVAADKFNHSTFDVTAFEPCKALWESVHINADGNVFPCLAISYGNVKNLGIEKIVFTKEATRLKSKIRSCGLVAACKGCGYLKVKQ